MFSVSRALGWVLLCSGALLAGASQPLRVCADPNNLPYSNEQRQGFENELAEMVAKDLGTQVSYTWYPQREKFFERTLESGRCDVVMGVPAGFEEASTTRPYYRSTYVFISRRDRNLHIHSFDDARLHHLRIGVHVLGDSNSSLPPVHALINRGIIKNLVGYSIFGNLAESNPSSDLIKAVSNREVDVAVAWGPLGGYFARRSAVPLSIDPIATDVENPALPLAFNIAIGVRPGDKALRQELDGELQRLQPQIRQLLRSYGIPQVNPTLASMEEY